MELKKFTMDEFIDELDKGVIFLTPTDNVSVMFTLMNDRKILIDLSLYDKNNKCIVSGSVHRRYTVGEAYRMYRIIFLNFCC